MLGLIKGSDLVTVPMSEDHTAADETERGRVQSDHPRDPSCCVQVRTKPQPRFHALRSGEENDGRGRGF